MNSERLDLPPVPSVARITQPANEDTVLFILQSILRTGAHLPAGKWTSLVKLLWESPSNPGPFLWMGKWVHPYALYTLCRCGWILGKMGYC